MRAPRTSSKSARAARAVRSTTVPNGALWRFEPALSTREGVHQGSTNPQASPPDVGAHAACHEVEPHAPADVVELPARGRTA